ncbi:MAG: hypothetical protein ACREDS_09620, partial [Limisphaerales bacterium]
TKDEIVEHFRELPFDEKCEVVLQLRQNMANALDAEEVAKFDKTIARVCENPDRKSILERVRANLIERGLLPCLAK